jgi:hypothetical protein
MLVVKSGQHRDCLSVYGLAALSEIAPEDAAFVVMMMQLGAQHAV